MSFEKRVLSVVSQPAKFEYGTLFVECTAKEAAKLETVLIEEFKCGIIVSDTGSEFAFDFV